MGSDRAMAYLRYHLVQVEAPGTTKFASLRKYF